MLNPMHGIMSSRKQSIPVQAMMESMAVTIVGILGTETARTWKKAHELMMMYF